MDAMDIMDTNGHVFYGQDGHVQQVTFFAPGSVWAWEGKHQSQPGRLRYLLNRKLFLPSKQQPL